MPQKKPNLKHHPLLAKTDPDQELSGPEFIGIAGYIGPSKKAGCFRLYTDLGFDSYYEIPEDAVHSTRDGEDENQPSTVFIAIDTKLEHITRRRVDASFLRGNVTKTHYEPKVGRIMVCPTVITAIPTNCGDSREPCPTLYTASPSDCPANVCQDFRTADPTVCAVEACKPIKTSNPTNCPDCLTVVTANPTDCGPCKNIRTENPTVCGPCLPVRTADPTVCGNLCLAIVTANPTTCPTDGCQTLRTSNPTDCPPCQAVQTADPTVCEVCQAIFTADPTQCARDGYCPPLKTSTPTDCEVPCIQVWTESPTYC